MTFRPIFFDLETTGVHAAQDRIVEIAAYDPRKDKTFQALVFPKMKIPKDAMAIHGITDEMVANEPPFEIISEQFLQFCEGEVLLIAHNGEAFDFPFLAYEFQRAKKNIPQEWFGLDSLKWARKYRKDLPRHSLQYLRQIWNIPENKAHRALDDTYILWSIFSLMSDDLSCEELLERCQGGRFLDLVKNTLKSVNKTSLEQKLF
jgi:DNA polymerase-3 subunit epsilon